jgi:hypothetical protein
MTTPTTEVAERGGGASGATRQLEHRQRWFNGRCPNLTAAGLSGQRTAMGERRGRSWGSGAHRLNRGQEAGWLGGVT